ncbi:putative SPF1-P-type ATPase [Microstroma glucosiphilum]|uniref:Putative SPF1-P-type ATPase n=1 Tax=Pseudomicrostroma glucosiphilum TaxID=1684307 RepID=A0A316U243_9BASI|nr:putative SPF1-P-type ATPase [Pseudomicrostroma glucosiphilum]PWN18493.1 putative SPF1-P-type ATPase [Pseudomicrostroma glucosiphilum]
MSNIAIVSPDIASVSLHVPKPLVQHFYVLPFLFLYPLYFYTYNLRYDDWVKSEEWTFVYSVLLFTSHALAYLITRWSIGFKAWATTKPVKSLQQASLVRVIPHPHKGEGEMVPLKISSSEVSFVYQADKYILAVPDSKAPTTAVNRSADITEPTFRRLPYPADSAPPLSHFQASRGLVSEEDALQTLNTYGGNVFEIPKPTFVALFIEHAVAPFFVFQVFCVGLWMLDEYWYYSLFTLFMLIMFECTVVFQRLRTLNEFRTMSITPFQIYVYRSKEWLQVPTTELLPGDVVSITRTKEDLATPCDLLLLGGTAIVNEAMLSGESTPLLKESIELREGSDKLDVNGTDRNSVVFGGTKVLQTTSAGAAEYSSVYTQEGMVPPDGGAIGLVLRTGFGTSQGQLIRLMVFTNEGRVTAGNIEAFLFIGFLLIFAIAASWYVWTRGLEMGRPKGKLLLDCVLIITSVVPPELPMELSMAVNSSLMALSKKAIFCTEPFRIPYAGKVDVCCFDKTGTITDEDLEVQGVAAIGAKLPRDLIDLQQLPRETTITLGAAHALVLLEDGMVGDPMEKTTLEAMGWQLAQGDVLSPKDVRQSAHRIEINVRRRFQFSSALKRMSTLSYVSDLGGANRKLFAAVKGAPETLKGMYSKIPDGYDETYKGFTRRGSRVLALGYKYVDKVSPDGVKDLTRDQVESELVFGGFLIFHCPLKSDAKGALQQLHDSSHRCIMITGDNPLTAVHVAEEVEIVDRETLILDAREGASKPSELAWKTTDESKIINLDASEALDESLFDTYDICMTGAAMAQFSSQIEKWEKLVQNTWVYARVSPSQKELILNTLKRLGYVTLMAGDGTNDVGALKAAHVGVALLDGTPEDLLKIAEHQRNERMKKVYMSQLSLSQRFNAPPPVVPPTLKDKFPELEAAREEAVKKIKQAKLANPNQAPPKFDLASLQAKMQDMDTEDGPPQIKLGDASVAAPFTSKLRNVNSIVQIIRQGRASLVATVQMYKILGLNCLIQAYSLSVMYLDGIKFGDYQVTITGMLLSVAFLFISKAEPKEKLSRERPLTTIFSWYIFSSVMLQFALHLVSMHYVSRTLVPLYEVPAEEIDVEAKFTPSLLNSAVFLINLSQQVNTVAVNFIGEPFREKITANRGLYLGLLGCGSIAVAGALELFPELNEWLQLVKMPTPFQIRLVAIMLVDYIGCYVIEWITHATLADLRPSAFVTKGRDRRDQRRKNLIENLEAATEIALKRGEVEKAASTVVNGASTASGVQVNGGRAQKRK